MMTIPITHLCRPQLPRFSFTSLVSAALILTVSACSEGPAPQTSSETKPEVSAKQLPSQAAVAMPDRYSAEVSSQILEQGGNAVDAAARNASMASDSPQ